MQQDQKKMEEDLKRKGKELEAEKKEANEIVKSKFAEKKPEIIQDKDQREIIG